jgi:hypothetical protein
MLRVYLGTSLLIAFIVVGAVGTYLFQIRRNAQFKKKYFASYVTLAVGLFAAYIGSFAPALLIIGLPFMALIAFIGFRETKFCESCGRTIRNSDFCHKCNRRVE